MLSLASAGRLLLVFSLGAYAVLLIRLRTNGLSRVYRFFWIYVAVRLVRAAAMILIISNALGRGKVPERTNLYGWTYTLSDPLLWALYILVILELFGLVLRNYPGIATFGRWVLSGGLVLAFAITVVTLYADLRPGDRFPILMYLYAVKRAVLSTLALYILLIAGFMAWFPMALNRNLIAHTFVFALYFLSGNVSLWVRNRLGHSANEIVGTVFQAVACLCLVGWIWLLTPQGEAQKTVVRPRWRPEDEENLVRQLQAVNAALGRTRRS